DRGVLDRLGWHGDVRRLRRGRNRGRRTGIRHPGVRGTGVRGRRVLAGRGGTEIVRQRHVRDRAARLVARGGRILAHAGLALLGTFPRRVFRGRVGPPRSERETRGGLVPATFRFRFRLHRRTLRLGQADPALTGDQQPGNDTDRRDHDDGEYNP